MRVLETGNHLIALVARAVGVEVVSAYPITPQTQIIEKIAEMISNGEMEAQYIPVESEHSACAALVSASLTGARAFSATSAHGLAYMHEMLHYAAGIRVPVVMANVNRAIGPGWNIWCDHQDSISQRDTGWLQVYISSHQEAVDTLIQAYRITENYDVMLPLMLNLDAFVLSHTYMSADVPEREEVERFLPKYKPLWKLDTKLPVTHGSVVYPSEFSETRQSMEEGQENARDVIREVSREFESVFGRWHGDLVETYRMEDAEYAIVAMGTIASEARVTVERLREHGCNAGLLRVRFFRPFPKDEIASCLSGTKAVVVFDRDFSYGMSGALFTEVRSSLYSKSDVPVFNVIVGLGGRDVTYEQIEQISLLGFSNELDEVTWGDSHLTESHMVTFELLGKFRELYGLK
ncbi:MAG: transketolase C-terminal domain-containing protein [Actinomycetota bacterium]|nr:transketolase C-terminal domain-containing protein [Actinomycetota bacterium]